MSSKPPVVPMQPGESFAQWRQRAQRADFDYHRANSWGKPRQELPAADGQTREQRQQQAAEAKAVNQMVSRELAKTEKPPLEERNIAAELLESNLSTVRSKAARRTLKQAAERRAAEIEQAKIEKAERERVESCEHVKLARQSSRNLSDMVAKLDPASEDTAELQAASRELELLAADGRSLPLIREKDQRLQERLTAVWQRERDKRGAAFLVARDEFLRSTESLSEATENAIPPEATE